MSLQDNAIKKPEAKKPEWPRRTCPEEVLIKLAERVSYTSILKDLMKRVKPKELGITAQGIRETCSKDLLVNLKISKEGRGWLYSTFKEVIGASGSVRHIIPSIEAENADIDLNTNASAIWRQIVGDLIEARIAGGATKKVTLWGLVKRNRSVISALLKKISHEMIIFRRQCIARLFERQHL